MAARKSINYDKEEVQCDICGSPYYSSRGLWKHEAVRNSRISKSLKCLPFCITLLDVIISHVLSSRENFLVIQYTCSKFSCGVMGMMWILCCKSTFIDISQRIRIPPHPLKRKKKR